MTPTLSFQCITRTCILDASISKILASIHLLLKSKTMILNSNIPKSFMTIHLKFKPFKGNLKIQRVGIISKPNIHYPSTTIPNKSDFLDCTETCDWDTLHCNEYRAPVFSSRGDEGSANFLPKQIGGKLCQYPFQLHFMQ